MIDPERVLQPLAAADAAVNRLDSYTTPGELATAIEETQHAIERVLRLLLRADPEASDDLRMAALAPDTALDAVVSALRQRGLVTIELAGRLHELRQAAERARSGNARARDADVARDAVRLLRYEVEAAGEPVRRVAHDVVARHGLEEPPHEVPPPSATRGRGQLVVVALVIAGIAIAAALWLTRTDPVEEGIRAFGAGRLAVAERELARAVEDDSSNVTALLYLGRIHRTSERYEEARAVLVAAARTAPEDADVQRELGYLFLDLGAPLPAIERFRRAQELEPEAVASWVGLVRALRAAGDPSAEAVLARAPAEAQALLGRP